MGHSPPRDRQPPRLRPGTAQRVLDQVIALVGLLLILAEVASGKDEPAWIAFGALLLCLSGVATDLRRIDANRQTRRIPPVPPPPPAPPPPPRRRAPERRVLTESDLKRITRANYLELIDTLECDPNADFSGIDGTIARIHVELGGKIDVHGHPVEPVEPEPERPAPDPAAAHLAMRVQGAVRVGRDFAQKLTAASGIPASYLPDAWHPPKPPETVRERSVRPRDEPTRANFVECPECHGLSDRRTQCDRCGGNGFLVPPAYPAWPTTKIRE